MIFKGGFSLFGNLAASGIELDDIELDSDNEVFYHPTSAVLPVSTGPIGHSVIVEEKQVPTPAPAMRAFLNRDEAISFDPSVPLFFAVPPRLRDNSGKKTVRPKDIFDIAKEKGWTGGFYRTATEYVSLQFDPFTLPKPSNDLLRMIIFNLISL